MEQERKIGEVFDKCVFNGRPECCNYYCLYFERQDKQDVHFEKVED